MVALGHGYGCGVAIDAPDAVIPIRTLRHISQNPDCGGEVMVVSLGCEKLQPERLLPPGSLAIRDERETAPEPLDVVCLQNDAHVGFMSMVGSIMRQAEAHLERLNARRRETVPAGELGVGVQCGGSDAFSGVTANPALGYCADLLVRAGAGARDGVVRRLAAARRRRPQRQHHAGQPGRWPVQHRREGDGLDRQVGHRTDQQHARTGREAAGQGPDLCRHAGRIADGTTSIEDMGWELFHLMLEVASGRRKAWAEHRKLHNALVLFNPAPVT